MASTAAIRRTSALLAALAAAAVLASCGGGGDDAADTGDKASPSAGPEPAAVKLLKQAIGPNRTARSGRIDARTEITLTGVKGFEEPFAATLSGPYSYRKGAALPDYELQLGVRDNGVGLTSLNGRSWVLLGTTGFKLPAAVRSRLERLSARGRNGLTRTLEQFGIAPWRWETNQRIAEQAKLDGVAVQHITTGFTSGAILKDANTLLGLLAPLRLTRATGLPDMIPRSARKVIARNVTVKQGHQWVGLKDKVIRRSGFTMKFTIPKADRAKVGGISGGSVVGELTVTDVGKPQTIGAPATIGSFPDFELGVEAVGDAQGG
jgi:hypothetical protein